MKAVISQSMYFPWVGFLEQIRLADVLVHYDDVQFSRGSFTNRVQVKNENGIKWMTVPLRNQQLGQNIEQIIIDNRTDWRNRHLNMLNQAYLKAPFRDEMLALVDQVLSNRHEMLSDLSRESLLALANYFNLSKNTLLMSSSQMGIGGTSNQRVLDLCLHVGASLYITGHGARNYLNHELFDQTGIRVEYMRYRMIPYNQLHGEFTPFVTALDLVANYGSNGEKFICSDSIYWKDFLNESN
jgi:hypothetical protein